MAEVPTSPFIQVENFSLTAQYGGGSVALFPLDANGKLGEPTVTEHQGGSKVVDRRQDSPHPIGQDSLPMVNMPSFQTLGLIRSLSTKWTQKSPLLPNTVLASPFPAEVPVICGFQTMGNSFICSMSSVCL